MRTLLRINGMIPSADVWLNGNLVAEQAAVAGAYPVHELDVTRWVHAGANTLALRVHPGDPRTSLSIGWVDWNPTPPDNNMGPWRGVDIVRTGPVQIRFPQVTSTLSLPDLSRAALTVKVEARNLDASAHDATITGVVAGVSLRRTIHLAPGETQTVSFSPKTDPGLDLNHPQIWWPVGMGAHPLYSLQMAAAVDDAISDRASATFGIRSVSSHLTKQGYLQFVINGKPRPDSRRGLGAGHVPARRPQAHGGRVQLRPEPRAQHHSQRGQAGGRTLLRPRRPRRHHDPRRLGVLRQMGIVGQDGWRAVGRCGREGGCSLDGERGAPAAEPPVRDRIPDRQRQRAAAGDRQRCTSTPCMPKTGRCRSSRRRWPRPRPRPDRPA